MNLAEPETAFHWSGEPWGPALRCDPLERVAQHVFTSRQLELQGNVASRVKGWTALTTSLQTTPTRLMRSRQVHGRTVRVLARGTVGAEAYREQPDADALVSNEPGVALAVVVADCVPILLADPRTGTAAAVHAGWRGTCAGIVGTTLAAMGALSGVQPSDLVAAIGPSIGPCCYEVGGEVREAFRQAVHAGVDSDRWFSHADGSLRLDLWRANRDQLRRAGVPESQIFTCALCTSTHRDLFPSHRADRERAGRMAAAIVVPG